MPPTPPTDRPTWRAALCDCPPDLTASEIMAGYLLLRRVIPVDMVDWFRSACLDMRRATGLECETWSGLSAAEWARLASNLADEAAAELQTFDRLNP